MSAGLILFLEHEADYNCAAPLSEVCLTSWLGSTLPIFDCGSIMASSVARPFDLPLTLYAASYYLIGIALTLTLLILAKPSAARNSVKWVTGLYGWGLLTVTLFLLGYSLVEFRRLCRVCLLFYLINFGLFAATRLLFRPRRHPTKSRDDAARVADRLLALVLAVSGLFAMIMIAVLGYGQWVRHSEANLGSACPAVAKLLPTTPLRRGAADAPRSLVLFIDPACAACRADWPSIRELTATTTVDVYLFPLDRQCKPEGSDLFSHPASDAFGSCQASAALICVQRHDIMPWEEYLEELFKLQDAQDIRTETLLALAPTASREQLRTCMENGSSEDEVRHHRAVGESLGIRATPWLGVQQDLSIREVPRKGREHFIKQQLDKATP